ncbi:NlpC/P60 family protein [Actinopolyspora alba]|uniref:NlpC/P60 family protein n=1 Tax=Actinopolyspora alba TaxID=673379 RepID=A0A1I1YU39_9ACTN|nr:NlpC/P60 family protein [Actinopolyspora alba]SFE22971.1 NlpC/P60 family protein [Actinopolyspora alba]
MTNARTITNVVMRRRLPQRAAMIALSTAIVESRLRNLPYGERDSLVLFQQRPSQSWNTREQILNHVYATNTFLDHLVDLPGCYRMPPGVAQQKMQRSAFPERYSPYEKPTRLLMEKLWRGSDGPVPPSTGGLPAQQSSAALGCPDQGGLEHAAGPTKAFRTVLRCQPTPSRRSAVKYALSNLDTPYVWAPKGPNAFDCSGLMQAAWAHAGMVISAGTSGQQHDGHAVGSLAQLQPGHGVPAFGECGVLGAWPQTGGPARLVGDDLGAQFRVAAVDRDLEPLEVVAQLPAEADQIGAVHPWQGSQVASTVRALLGQSGRDRFGGEAVRVHRVMIGPVRKPVSGCGHCGVDVQPLRAGSGGQRHPPPRSC